MQGEDTDIRALEEQYKIPAFFNLTICITGFSDSELSEHLRQVDNVNICGSGLSD